MSSMTTSDRISRARVPYVRDNDSVSDEYGSAVAVLVTDKVHVKEGGLIAPILRTDSYYWDADGDRGIGVEFRFKNAKHLGIDKIVGTSELHAEGPVQ